MQNDKIENHIDFLLSMALKKCENIHDAEDLTQETLLSALSYLAKGETIRDLRAWLIRVLNYKWSDALRKKYRQPIIGIGEGFDIIDEDADIANIEKTDEAEQVRKALAFLTKLYREVMVRHYMDGESVADIAVSLGVPEGTVKSRLYGGRMQMKKGIADMENYSRQSYQPITLGIANSGNCGINHEPGSLVSNDLLAQNILWAAYKKPITAEEIAKMLGTPTAYVEPIIGRLVDGELMKAIGNRYYTDFIISTVEDRERYIPQQKRFVSEYFDLLWGAIGKGLACLREQSFYQRGTFDEKNSLEMYFVFNCLDYGLYWIFCDIFKEEQKFPFRKDGGRWIAFGHVYTNEKIGIEILKHCYSGERFLAFRDYAGCSLLEMHVYGADGFPTRCYLRFPDDAYLRDGDDADDIVTRLLHIIHSGIDPASVGFHTEYLKAIPWLTECKILREENGKPHVNIPILNKSEFEALCGIMEAAKREMFGNADLKKAFATFLEDKKQPIPAHLDSVPIHKQYFYAENAILYATLREAMRRGEIYDGNYDDDSEGIRQHPCPMILVIEN